MSSSSFKADLTKGLGVPANEAGMSVKVAGKNYELTHGDVVIAAITSCTNTSNPSVLVAAGLVARKAHAKGLKPKPWVKTSLAPGSQVVTEYLDKSGLTADLDAIGFETVGYGCTTCIGNSGPLDDAIVDAIEDNKLVGAAVISGNRNFEGRVHANVRANYLASPPLVVAYALLGKVTVDITTEPLGTGSRRPAGLSEATCGRRTRRSPTSSPPACRATSSSSATARCSRARSSGRRFRSRATTPPIAGRTAPPM